MASAERHTSYTLALTEAEFKTVAMALDNISCDDETYGPEFSGECHQIWKVMNV